MLKATSDLAKPCNLVSGSEWWHIRCVRKSLEKCWCLPAFKQWVLHLSSSPCPQSLPALCMSVPHFALHWPWPWFTELTSWLDVGSIYSLWTCPEIWTLGWSWLPSPDLLFPHLGTVGSSPIGEATALPTLVLSSSSSLPPLSEQPLLAASWHSLSFYSMKLFPVFQMWKMMLM